MKKTLTIVLALVLALSMLASFAFVLNPGTGGAIKPDKSPLVITGFFVTDNLAIVGGARVYAPLADNTSAAYAKNEVIRFAITMDVLNPMIPANAIDPNWNTAEDAVLTVTSDTVDFAVSAMAGQQALHVPLSQLVSAINSRVLTTETFGATLGDTPATKNVLTLKIHLAAGDPSTANFVEAPGVKGDPIALFTPDVTTQAKASYAFIFTGITKGEITDQGLAKLVTSKIAGTEFEDDEVIAVVKNGRTYLVQKVEEASAVDPGVLVKHPTITTGLSPAYYQLFKVGYRVYLVTAETADDYTAIPVAQLDSESVRWAASLLDLDEAEVEGLGYSLGLEKIKLAAQTVDKTGVNAMAAPNVVPANDQARVFRTVLSDGTVRYILGDGTAVEIGTDAFNATELARLNTMLADFGFSTADNYTYKLEDKYFTTAGADANVLTATYNNGTVVPVEPDEEPDVGEETDDEDLPDEDLDEIEEGEDVIEDDVPAETGDFASDIAIALTAAAIVAAAALAFVMKKARD